MTGHRRRGERGQVAGIEVLPFGLLVFVAGTLLITSIWGVVDTKFAADTAAREATRWIAESAGGERTPDDLRLGAATIATATLAEHGRRPPRMVSVTPTAATFARCERIRVTVEVDVPVVRIPFVGAWGGPVEVTASHTEMIDPTRSGVGGTASCIR